ncbi:phytase [Amanita rubescens]|nr:phytase [Amanita rubescens]
MSKIYSPLLVAPVNSVNPGVRASWRWLPGHLLALLVLAYLYLYRHGKSKTHVAEFPITIPVPLSIQRNWGAYRPWFPVADYTPPPEQCSITQVNILQRHGARYPTRGAQAGILAALDKLKSAEAYLHPHLIFLKSYEYDLRINDLVYFGAQQAKFTGKETFLRYPYLVNEDNLPFVRASGSQRVIDSATNWTLGFTEASNHIYHAKLNVILDENQNCTLDNNQCPNAGSADFAVDSWINQYAYPISTRLNSLAPGSNLTQANIYGLQLICPFESIAHISHSPFCDLFTQDEFASFEYVADLDKFYGTGYGQPLGRVQGVGYVNELLARLTGLPVRDRTQTNGTLDEDGESFPLGRGVYADFSHDNEMVAIFSAMGLFVQGRALDPSEPDEGRTWFASRMVPFGARMVVERLVCHEDGGEYVRVLVNDEVQPLEFCGGEEGLCELGAFVESQSYARNNGEGDWEACFDNTPEVPM